VAPVADEIRGSSAAERREMARPPSRLRRWLWFTRHSINPLFFWGLVYSAVARQRFRKCGRGLQLTYDTAVRGYGNIVIGDDFVSMGRLHMYAERGYLEIGNNSDVNTNVQLGASDGKLIIGNHVMIASNVVIRAANHGIDRASPMKSQPPTYGEIIIEDDVWIGANAVITADVRIARGTVVAAGAVVTKSTEPYSIVGGVPARKIGERV
jgi:galactoside O-acetyltransferase